MRLCLLLLVLCACGMGGGSGPSRLTFGDTFEQPIVVGAPVKVRTQLPNGLFPSDVDGTLVVLDVDGKEIPVTKRSTGNFEVVLPRPGEFTFNGTAGLDEGSLTVRAEEMDALVVESQAVVTRETDNSTCRRAAQSGPVTLAPNESLEVNLVPKSKNGQPMLGAIDFEVLDVATWVSRPVLFAAPNEFSIRAAGDGSATFTDKRTGRFAVQVVSLAETDAACP
ncbi:MAG: hypothetical protein JNK82_05370 [Myxococcaceae bacterium]|nr:hypothetical protein [Myxococcaceae bacterium]